MPELFEFWRFINQVNVRRHYFSLGFAFAMFTPIGILLLAGDLLEFTVKAGFGDLTHGWDIPRHRVRKCGEDCLDCHCGTIVPREQDKTLKERIQFTPVYQGRIYGGLSRYSCGPFRSKNLR